MYIYVKNESVIRKTLTKDDTIDHDIMYEVEWKPSERFVYEEGVVKRYEDSWQYKIDKNILSLTEQNALLKREKEKIQNEQDKFLNEFARLKSKTNFISQVKNA